MRFEKAGIPTILFASTAFVPLARSIAQTSGLNDLRMVVVDHPLGGISEDDLRQRVDAAYAQTVELLAEAEDADAEPASADDVAVDAARADAPDAAVVQSDAQPQDAEPTANGTSRQADVDAALDELRQSLANDGAGLVVGNADDQAISVELTFTDETCMDCVIPSNILESIITDALERHGFEQQVSVIDPRA